MGPSKDLSTVPSDGFTRAKGQRTKGPKAQGRKCQRSKGPSPIGQMAEGVLLELLGITENFLVFSKVSWYSTKGLLLKLKGVP